MKPTRITLAEDLSIEQIGAEMARLRAQFGLTPHEVSQRLHIRARYVTAIEEGKLDLLPGKVYARGYIQTYADFLGLDPAHTVQQCFGGEGAVSGTTVHRPPPLAKPVSTFQEPNYRAILAGLLVLVGLVFLAGQWLHRPRVEEPEVSLVTPVPEEMLDTMRTMVMPTAYNYECFTSGEWFACARQDVAARTLAAIGAHPFPLTGDIVVEPLLLNESSNEQEEPSLIADDVAVANDDSL